MAGDAVEWAYDGPKGPENWGSLSEEYAACAAGKQQSPVDITGYVDGEPVPLYFSYGTDANEVRNDGKAVHFDYAPGNTLSIGQRTLTLMSAHMHSPSEHLLDGASFAAELHMIHQDADGKLAVVGQFFRHGDPSPAVQAILDAAPAPGETVAAGIGLNARRIHPGRTGLLPLRRLEDHPALRRAGRLVRDAAVEDHLPGTGRRPPGAQRRPQ